MPVSAWSTTAASNGATLGIDIAEDCAAANINNALREMMAQIKTKLDAIDALIGSGSYQPLDADLTAIAALTSAANKMPYATGSGAWALADLSAAARTVLDDGDVATMRTTLAALGLTSATFAANSVALQVTLSNGDTLLIQGGSGTLGANTTGTITFATAYSTAPIVIAGGGDANSSSEGQIRISANPTTTGVAIINAGPAIGTYNWLAIGKA